MAMPLLFIGDSPSLNSGLGRIGRDLASLSARLPEFRVGYFGRGGAYTRALPFPQYTFDPSPLSQWGEIKFPTVWRDFTGNGVGLCFTVWDPSRLTWFGNPDFGGVAEWADLQNTLRSPTLGKWGYFAIDGAGPRGEGGLTGLIAKTIDGYDRVLAYGPFGEAVIKATGIAETNWLPHGIDMAKWQPKPAESSRLAFKYTKRDVVVGCVMTNQTRKDWGVFLAAMAMTATHIPNLRVICKTDDLTSHWDIRALVEDFGLDSIIRFWTAEATDSDMAHFYSACDLTVLPSSEGFGYPIVESLACGVPVVHVNYAGGADLVSDKSYLCPVDALKLETRWNVLRPVINPQLLGSLVVDKLRELESFTETERASRREMWRATVEHLDWKKLWPLWRRWMLEGLEENNGL